MTPARRQTPTFVRLRRCCWALPWGVTADLPIQDTSRPSLHGLLSTYRGIPVDHSQFNLCGHGDSSLLLQQIDDTGNVTVVVDWHALTLEKALALVVGVRRVRDWANLQWAWIRRLVKIVLHV